MSHILITEDACKGCGLCVEVCPKKCILLAANVNVRGYNPAVFSIPEECTGCANCAVMCPDAVIEAYRTPKKKK
ncbi:MAG: 4Fe-4S dicluster domain-containing protein [Planctomycetota bacterium]|jgi:2-oxoglutarate ferredoxin oxidoreductase subunit delta